MESEMLSFLGVLLTSFTVALNLDCSSKEDGVYELGCRSFTKCTNGTSVVMFCDSATVFNTVTQTCDDAFNVPPPCGTYKECSTLSDGGYPDIDRMCLSYYICQHGNFLGHSICPSGLVFNQGIQVCDWPFNVSKPCGTLPAKDVSMTIEDYLNVV